MCETVIKEITNHLHSTSLTSLSGYLSGTRSVSDCPPYPTTVLLLFLQKASIVCIHSFHNESLPRLNLSTVKYITEIVHRCRQDTRDDYA